MNTDEADAHFAGWMCENLDIAAAHFDLEISGQPIFGWRLRSISARANGSQGARWLRVVSQEPQWAQGNTWTGTLDSNTIVDVPKPRVLDVFEWADGRQQRAEVMTLMPGQVCSPTDSLRSPVPLSEMWWSDLKNSLGSLVDTCTHRTNSDQQQVTKRIHARFGHAVDTTVDHWETVHGDLHWSNLVHPRFGCWTGNSGVVARPGPMLQLFIATACWFHRPPRRSMRFSPMRSTAPAAGSRNSTSLRGCSAASTMVTTLT